MRLLATLILTLIGGALNAQTIDREQTRLLSAPHARPGTYAPLRVRFDAPVGATTARIETTSATTILTRKVAIDAPGPQQARLPILIAKGATVRVTINGESDEMVIAPPARAIGTSYSLAYAAVFSQDPAGARQVVPSDGRTLTCDYYEISEFFSDWRMLDGYDALIVLNPGAGRLPPGSQRVIAEFAALGGVVFVAGSFLFGEAALSIPPPGEPEPMTLEGTPVHRMAYGQGAIYRVSFSRLRTSRSARKVILRALRDHRWFGAIEPPRGNPGSRAAPERALTAYLPARRGEPGVPGPLGVGLIGLLLLLVSIGPVLARRILARPWSAPIAVAVGSLLLSLAGGMQSGPDPAAEVSVIEYSGANPLGASSLRWLIVAEPDALRTWTTDLDDPQDRRLARPVRSVGGRRAWLVDQPLAGVTASAGPELTLTNGLVEGIHFRDFATRATLGKSGMPRDNARLLNWWLETNAYAGRSARIRSCAVPKGDWPFADHTVVRSRGAISITNLRAQR